MGRGNNAAFLFCPVWRASSPRWALRMRNQQCFSETKDRNTSKYDGTRWAKRGGDVRQIEKGPNQHEVEQGGSQETKDLLPTPSGRPQDTATGIPTVLS